jgi:hypothetical protein
MKINFLKLTILFIIPFSLLTALEDTKENRTIQAERHLKEFSMADMLEDTWTQMFKFPPFSAWSEKQKKYFTKRMTAIVSSEEYNKILLDVFTETFTADELKAFADFYASKHGKSSMKKMNLLVANMMPKIQGMMQDEMTLLMEEVMNFEE